MMYFYIGFICGGERIMFIDIFCKALFERKLNFIFLVFFISFVFIATSHAQNTQPSLSLSEQGNSGDQPQLDVKSLMRQLMAKYPNGGPRFISAVADLARASPDSVSDIIAAVNSSPSKVHSIDAGKALARAVIAINQTNPEAASRMAAVIARSGNQNLQVAFLGGTGDQTAANQGDGSGQGIDQGTGQAGTADQPGATGGGATGGGFPSGGTTGGTFPGTTGTGGGGGSVSPS